MVERSDKISLLLFLSGLCGFLVGIIGHSTWHHAVEGAQVLAGIVSYPTPTPAFIYQIRAWTLLHQIPALFLRLGISEIALSYIVSGILGMLAYQALATICYAFCRNFLFSLLVPFLIDLTWAYFFGISYLIALTGMIQTYGVAGLSMGMLILGIIALQHWRKAAFLLGLFPCIHLGLGVWLGLFVLIAVAIDAKFRIRISKPVLLCFGVGLMLTVISFLIQLNYARSYLLSSNAIGKPYLETFILHLDSHRAALMPKWDMLIPLGTWMLAVYFLYSKYKDINAPHRIYLRVIFLIGVFCGITIFVSHLPPSRLPVEWHLLMPNRLWNILSYAFAPMFFGLLYAHARGLKAQLFLIVAITGLLFFCRYGKAFTLFWLTSCWVAFIFLHYGNYIIVENPKKNLWFVLSLALLFIFCIYKISVRCMHGWFTQLSAFNDWRTDTVLAHAEKGTGILLADPDIELVQLRTRRPILLNPLELDQILYALQSATQANQILKEIYDMDLLNPSTLNVPNKVLLWPDFTREQWVQLKDRFGFTQILGSEDLILKLPERARNDQYVLYDVA